MRILYLVTFLLLARLTVVAQADLSAPPGVITALATAKADAAQPEDEAGAIGACQAQMPVGVPDAPSAETKDGNDPAVLPHHLWKRFWVSGQMNVIEQGHGDFRSLYSGPRSLSSKGEQVSSRIFTLYTAARLSDASDVIFDIEDASGGGISNSNGLAGFTNIDVVRIPGEGSPLSAAPYVARATFRYVFRLSRDNEESETGIQGMLANLPVKRLEIRVGKFSLPDYFDVNAVGSDSHLQFMNWTLVSNGAWDYAADTRGYTFGAMADLHARNWSLRFAEALMPKVANGIDLEWDLSRAHAHNVELELRPHFLGKRDTKIRFLAYRNIAGMGSYRQAIDDFLAHRTTTPDIEASRRPGRSKNGVGMNAEQQLTTSLRAFVRLGWNDGRNESFAFTEVDRTTGFGGDFAGERWHRKHDRIGAAFVVNALSAEHRLYLALGGQGFLLGDGRLTYDREKIFEGYYTAHIWRGLFGALDFQHINNPGYNRDRGPVWVPAVRMHVDF